MLEPVGARRSGPQAKHLDQVRRIVFGLLGDLPATVFLFGSSARATATPASDIDIAILPGSPRAAARIPEIRDALEDSCVPFFVDVVDLAEADEALREAVLREGVRWTA
jgi:predicted nucleotidyltransferase